jgi:hypothetical protein
MFRFCVLSTGNPGGPPGRAPAHFEAEHQTGTASAPMQDADLLAIGRLGDDLRWTTDDSEE